MAAELSRQDVQEIKIKAIDEVQAKAEKRKKENAGKKPGTRLILGVNRPLHLKVKYFYLKPLDKKYTVGYISLFSLL